MGYRPVTKNGYNLWDILSLLQKSIRRNDKQWAIFAVNELESRNHNVAWTRLLTITVEDVNELVTRQVIDCMRSASFRSNNKELPPDQSLQKRWLTQAALLLCDAEKSRDTDNFIYVGYWNGNPPQEEITAQLAAVSPDECAEYEKYLSQQKHILFPGSADHYLTMDHQWILRHEKPLISIEGNVTRNGHEVTAVLAVLARALDVKNHIIAGWAVLELESGDFAATWNYLLNVIDKTCADQIKHEAYDLLRMTAMLCSKKNTSQVYGSLQLLKLVFLLCDKYPNFRKADRTVSEAEVAESLSNIEIPAKEFPDYTFDVHTSRGKRMGKTSHDFLFSETFSLTPKSPDDRFDPVEGTDYRPVFMRVMGHP